MMMMTIIMIITIIKLLLLLLLSLLILILLFSFTAIIQVFQSCTVSPNRLYVDQFEKMNAPPPPSCPLQQATHSLIVVCWTTYLVCLVSLLPELDAKVEEGGSFP